MGVIWAAVGAALLVSVASAATAKPTRAISPNWAGFTRTLPQARYGKITYTGISMHDAHGHTGTFANKNWLTTQYTMVNGHTLATSSALGNSGASFADTWVVAQ